MKKWLAPPLAAVWRSPRRGRPLAQPPKPQSLVAAEREAARRRPRHPACCSPRTSTTSTAVRTRSSASKATSSSRCRSSRERLGDRTRHHVALPPGGGDVEFDDGRPSTPDGVKHSFPRRDLAREPLARLPPRASRRSRVEGRTSTPSTSSRLPSRSPKRAIFNVFSHVHPAERTRARRWAPRPFPASTAIGTGALQVRRVEAHDQQRPGPRGQPGLLAPGRSAAKRLVFRVVKDAAKAAHRRAPGRRRGSYAAPSRALSSSSCQRRHDTHTWCPVKGGRVIIHLIERQAAAASTARRCGGGVNLGR